MVTVVRVSVYVTTALQASADKVGDKFGISRRYSSYAELVGDAEVDIVYIGMK